MKVLVPSKENIFYSNNAGANRLRSLLEGLSNKGVEIELLVFNPYKSSEEVRKYGKNGIINGISYCYLLEIVTNTRLKTRVYSFILATVLTPFITRRILHKIKRTKINILWILPELYSLKVFVRLKKKLGKNIFKFMEINEYEDVAISNANNFLHVLRAKKFTRILLNDVLPEIDFLAVMTDALYKHFLLFIDTKKTQILHLPMTVDLSRFENKSSRDYECAPYIAYCGGLNNAKDGIDILIRSFKIISNDVGNIRLILAGPKELDGDKNLELIKELELSERIDYLGVLNRQEIVDLLSNAEILALPRPESRQAEGGFPTKLGEYLASGKPVCVTRVGEIPDYLVDGESAFFAEPGSVDSFANSLRRALNDKKEAMRVGANGRKVAENNFAMTLQASRLYSFIIEGTELQRNAQK